MVSLPADLTALQSSFRTKNAFPHIQRLHNLVYAYGATLIEIVRRKEFGQYQWYFPSKTISLYSYSKLFLQTMSSHFGGDGEAFVCCPNVVSYTAYILPRAAERKRRQVYRGEVHGQLPFDPKGMDDAVPSIDFSTSGGKDGDSPYSLERADVSGAFLPIFLAEVQIK